MELCTDDSVQPRAQDVVGYFQQLGIRPSKDIRQFVQELERRHRRDVATDLSRRMQDRTNGQVGLDLYALKNQNLELSLDFVRFSADLYRRFFDWFVLQPFDGVRTILDVGCDNGFTTCFFARMYPGAKVIGIDTCREGIDCAQALAAKLKLENVRFIHGDFVSDDLIQGFLGQVDVIVSLRTMHEIAGDVNDVRYWSIADLNYQLQASMDSQHASLRALQQVEALLSPDGCFVTCERLTHAGSIYAWAWMMAHAGLCVNWLQAEWLMFHEVGMNQRMPIFMAKRDTAEQLQTEPFYRFLERGTPISTGPAKKIQDDAAAIIFEQTIEKRLIEGVEITYSNGAGCERLELWTSPLGILKYHRTDLGFRELEMLPGDRLESERKNLLDWFEQAGRHGNAIHYV